jgi:hypothetical protein
MTVIPIMFPVRIVFPVPFMRLMMRDLFDPSFTPVIVPVPKLQSQGPPLAIWVLVSSKTCASTWVTLYSVQLVEASLASAGRSPDKLLGGNLREKEIAPVSLSPEAPVEPPHEERIAVTQQRSKTEIRGNRIRALD